MSPFLYMVGVVFMVILICCVTIIVGLAVGALVAFVAGALGYAPQGSLDQHSGSRVRPPLPLALRTAVLDRDHWQCVYCGSTEELQIDHIIPVSRGGATTLDNLEVLCKHCN